MSCIFCPQQINLFFYSVLNLNNLWNPSQLGFRLGEDWAEDLKCTIELFADDTHICPVVKDSNVAADDIKHDLEHVKFWAHRWSMSISLILVSKI